MATAEQVSSGQHRRAALLTLLFAAGVLAGVLIVAVPTSQSWRLGSVHCGSPMSAAFNSNKDWRSEYFAAQIDVPPAALIDAPVQGYGSLPPLPRGIEQAWEGCTSSGKTRVVIGGSVVLATVLMVVALAVTGARRRRRAES